MLARLTILKIPLQFDFRRLPIVSRKIPTISCRHSALSCSFVKSWPSAVFQPAVTRTAGSSRTAKEPSLPAGARLASRGCPMTTESVVAVFFGLLGLALWMVPSLIAFSRKHPKRKAILLTDLLLSWTVIGWFLRWVGHCAGGKTRLQKTSPTKLRAKFRLLEKNRLSTARTQDGGNLWLITTSSL